MFKQLLIYPQIMAHPNQLRSAVIFSILLTHVIVFGVIVTCMSVSPTSHMNCVNGMHSLLRIYYAVRNNDEATMFLQHATCVNVACMFVGAARAACMPPSYHRYDRAQVIQYHRAACHP